MSAWLTPAIRRWAPKLCRSACTGSLFLRDLARTTSPLVVLDVQWLDIAKHAAISGHGPVASVEDEVRTAGPGSFARYQIVGRRTVQSQLLVELNVGKNCNRNIQTSGKPHACDNRRMASAGNS
jgi:hypothetical protein